MNLMLYLKSIKKQVISKTENPFIQNGADFTIKSMSELPQFNREINSLISEGKRPNAR